MVLFVLLFGCCFLVVLVGWVLSIRFVLIVCYLWFSISLVVVGGYCCYLACFYLIRWLLLSYCLCLIVTLLGWCLIVLFVLVLLLDLVTCYLCLFVSCYCLFYFGLVYDLFMFGCAWFYLVICLLVCLAFCLVAWMLGVYI